MSKHFPASEFACKDGTRVPPHLEPNREHLCASLEVIRAADGARGLEVVSGYRTAAYNRKKQGAAQSRHVTAEAADVRPIIRLMGVRVPWALVRNKREVIRVFHEMILRMCQEGELPGIGGVGVYPSWVHVDVRPKPPSGHLARWEGAGFGAEQVA